MSNCRLKIFRLRRRRRLFRQTKPALKRISPRLPRRAYQTAEPNYQPEFTQSTHAELPPPPAANVCIIHPEKEPAYYCDGCANLFCKKCPTAYGGTVKVCPMCGAMCKSLTDALAEQQKAVQYRHDMAEGFGFDDFGKALAYPFKFKTSLIAGAIMFMFATLGQSAAGVGGIFMIAAAIFCWMLSNMLTFGVLANTVNNMTQGRLDENFMPSFDDFNLWDDVVHPFFLSIAAYISSFGLVIVVVICAVWWTWNSAAAQHGEAISQMSQQMETAREEMRQARAAANSAPKPNQFSGRRKLFRKRRPRRNNGRDARLTRTRRKFSVSMNLFSRAEKRSLNPSSAKRPKRSVRKCGKCSADWRPRRFRYFCF
jgi:hypothetical protein